MSAFHNSLALLTSPMNFTYYCALKVALPDRGNQTEVIMQWHTSCLKGIFDIDFAVFISTGTYRFKRLTLPLFIFNIFIVAYASKVQFLLSN